MELWFNDFQNSASLLVILKIAHRPLKSAINGDRMDTPRWYLEPRCLLGSTLLGAGIVKLGCLAQTPASWGPSVMKFPSARQAGKKNATIPRPIFINLKHFQEVEKESSLQGSLYVTGIWGKIEKWDGWYHLKFCKTSKLRQQYSRLGWTWSLPLGIYVLSSCDILLPQTFKWYQNDLLNSAFNIQNGHHWK